MSQEKAGSRGNRWVTKAGGILVGSLLAVTLVLPGPLAAPAAAQDNSVRRAAGLTFPRSRLSVETRDGRRLPFEVEIAATPGTRMQGLMFRQSLAADGGMLFLWGETAPRTMWMKNTLIPLDMLFLDDRGWIVHIVKNTTPRSEALISPPVPVAAVLEVYAGTASLLSIEIGDRVVHPLLGDGN